MAVIDYIILAVVVISALVSFARGFLREVLSLAAWTIAIVVAFQFASDAAPYFGRWLSDPNLQYWAAVVALFLAALLCCGIVNWLIGQFFSEFGTSGTDRSLGIMLGAARGAVVVALLLLGARVISLPVDEWGNEAKLYPHFSQFSDWLWAVGSDMADGFGQDPGQQDTTNSTVNSAPANAPMNSNPAPADSFTEQPNSQIQKSPQSSPQSSFESTGNAG